MTEPIIVMKRALDVTPEEHGIYCTVGGGEPFVNHIATRRWSEDGETIWFMLESHNFDNRHPDEMMGVVELPVSPYSTPEGRERRRREDAEKMARRPQRRVWIRAPQEDLP